MDFQSSKPFILYIPAEKEDPVLSFAQYARLLAASAKGRASRARAGSSKESFMLSRGLRPTPQLGTAMPDCVLMPTQFHPTSGGFCRGRCRSKDGIRLKFKIRCVGAAPTGGCGADHPYDGKFGERQEQEDGWWSEKRRLTYFPTKAERDTPRDSFLEEQSHRFTPGRCRRRRGRDR
jgi:hypothetical protein